jgi:GntR family transcriptional regulator
MNISIDINSPVPIYIQILDQIKLLIAQKKLKTRDKLPSVRELALQLELNPRTISNAYRELAVQGLVEKKKGIGLFLTDSCKGFSEKEKGNQLEQKINELIEFGMMLGMSKEDIFREFTKVCSDGKVIGEE